ASAAVVDHLRVRAASEHRLAGQRRPASAGAGLMAAAEIVNLRRHGPWENYHRTGTANLAARWSLRSGDAGRGREELAEAAAAVQAWLLEAKRLGIPVRPVGGAWSLSNIQLVQDGWMLNTRRFNRCFRLAAEDFARPEA